MKRIVVVVLPMVAIIFHLLAAGSALNAESVGVREYQVLVGGLESTKYVVNNSADPIWSILIGSGDYSGSAISYIGAPQWRGANLTVGFDAATNTYIAKYGKNQITLFVNLPASFAGSERAYLFYAADSEDPYITATPVGTGGTGTFYAYNSQPWSPFIYTNVRLDDFTGGVHYEGNGSGESVHASVPIPAAILLLAPGIVALMGLKRKYLY
jgi:hypothetical protein